MICPICWKSNCPLLRKLESLKFTDSEKCEYMRSLHVPVCAKCKHRDCFLGVNCTASKSPRAGSFLPPWWKDRKCKAGEKKPKKARQPAKSPAIAGRVGEKAVRS